MTRQDYIGIIGLALFIVVGIWAASAIMPAKSEAVKGSDQVVVIDKSVTTTVVTKKDGTKVVTRTKKNVETKARTSVESVTTQAPMPRFSLGAGAVLDDTQHSKDAYVEGGLRTMGPVWLEGSYHFKSKETTVGIRVDIN